MGELRRANDLTAQAVEQARVANSLTREAQARADADAAEQRVRSAAQDKRAERQTKITEDELRLSTIQQRAWVGIPGTPVRPELNIDPSSGFLRVKVPIANSGNTPAFDVEVRMIIVEQPPQQPPPINQLAAARPTETSKALLLPNTSFNVEKTTEWPNGRTLIERLKSGTTQLYIVGRIKYRDASSVGRQTEFCMRSTSDGNMNMCPTFNNAR
jgi:hypothetical protein